MELEVHSEVEVHSSGSEIGNSQAGSSSRTSRTGNNPIDNTPTNAEMSLLKKACDDSGSDDLESLYPSVPLRTSSILPRPAMVCKVKQFHYKVLQNEKNTSNFLRTNAVLKLSSQHFFWFTGDQ